MKRKSILCCIAVVLILTLTALAGCGGKEPAKETGKPAAEEAKTLAPVKVTLTGGAVGGLWAASGEGIGEAIRRIAPNSSFGYQPGQDGANALTVSSGKAELGFLYAPMAKFAVEGTGPYKQKVDLKAIASFGALTYGILATEKSGLKNISDMKGKPVIIGVMTKDSSMDLINRTVLEEHGVSYESVEKSGGKVLYLPVGPTLDMMKDGRADAALTMYAIPEAKVVEAALTSKLTFLKPDPEALKKAAGRLGLPLTKIPKDTYTFHKEDITSFDVPAVLVCRSDLPDQVAYTVTKAMVEQLPYLQQVSMAFKKDTPQTMAVAPMKLHPGAEKYYREKGIIK